MWGWDVNAASGIVYYQRWTLTAIRRNFTIRVRKIPGSNLTTEAGYPDTPFMASNCPSRQEPRRCQKIGCDHCLPPFWNLLGIFTYSSVIQRNVIWVPKSTANRNREKTLTCLMLSTSSLLRFTFMGIVTVSVKSLHIVNHLLVWVIFSPDTQQHHSWF
jgi:hypothetical protein